MANDNRELQEVLEQLKIITANVVSSEYLKSELSHLKENTDIKVSDLREDIREIKVEIKEIHEDFENINTTISEFKMEMAPIIDFKKRVQSQIIKISSLAFLSLMALNLGMGSV